MPKKIRKLLAAALVLIMVFAAVPVLSLAEGARAVTYEARQMSKLDRVWAQLDAAEAKALAASRASKQNVISVVYQSALTIDAIDKDSFSDFTVDGFFFTVDGMYCAYNYRLRNEISKIPNPAPQPQGIIVEDYSNGKTVADRAPNSPNVLLVAPYYGLDSSFTNQYKTEAQSIANATGGTYTLIQTANATGPAIAQNYTNKGVVIYDSHGVQTGTSSYLCLTTNSGITTSDYNNGWAVRNGSSEAWIDGRYIENHVNGSLGNCFVWMAICEGMKRGGQGTTGSALLRAGAGGVYGYSQSVSFRGDYNYEATFWTEMKAGKTVAQAIQTMKSTHGNSDPYTNPSAWPIVMSATDAFPSNPDSYQNVTCNWTLLGGGNNPAPGTSYERVYSIENGGKYILVADSSVSGTTGYAVGNQVVSNNRYLNTVAISVNSNGTASVSSGVDAITWTASGSSSAGWTFKNVGNGKYMGLDSAQYLCPSNTAVSWKYTSSYGLDNQIDTDGYYYLSYSTGRYTTSKNTAAIRLYKVASGSNTPEPTTYTVTFKDWDGSVLKTQQVAYGGAATPPANPTRPGYTFTGWDRSYSYITANTVITAQYTKNNTYERVTTITPGDNYILVAANSVSGTTGYAVGNTVVSNNHYLTPVAVTINADGTLTVPSGVNANTITWYAGGSSYYGYTFRNLGNSKYLGLDSAQYLYPSSTSVAWKYTGGALDNQIDTDGYYYLSYSTGRYTTSKTSGTIYIYKVG